MTPPRRGPVLEDELSERDRAVLDDLARVRLLTGRQVQRLHLREGSPLTQARRTRSLLQRLNDLGLVHRLDRRVGGMAAGSSGFTYGLSGLGQRLTTGRGPAGGRRRRRPWEPSRYFTDHVLAVAELYVSLREAEATGQLDLVSFDAEPPAWRHWTGAGGEHLILKPDAYVVLGQGEDELLSFVEVDRSTESTTVLKKKALTYVTYWHAGVEQQRLGVFPRVCWLVPDERRKGQLVDVLSRLPPETWQLFSVGLLATAVDHLTTTNQHLEGGAYV